MNADWPRKLSTLYSPQQMRAVLHRERLRADRDRGHVSVALFETAPPPRGTPRALARMRFRRLACTMLKRARVTDELGWMSDRQLCAVLPGTSSFGAYCFADGVRKSAGARGLNVSYTIYVYPKGDEPGHGGPRRDSAEPREAIIPGVLERRGLEAAGADAPALPMQMLLKTPLPWWKRAMDVVGASIGLAASAPLMAASALLIRLTSPGPVLYRQQRAGHGGERFTILKFRTMVPDADKLKAKLRPQSHQDGPAFKMADDPRVTQVGRFLRSTSLDELPQLWNVLVGQMSLVGPRPLPVEESDACHGWRRHRLDVMPGLTCIWQVRGRSRVSFDVWMRMDMEYIRNRSLLHDLKILLLTLPAVILRRGAH